MRRHFDATRTPVYPPWAAVPYTLLALVIVPVYAVEYGPQNFLWFSDIALFATAWCPWTGNRLLASMMAVGVLPLELVWALDFAALGTIGVTAHMFDEQYPLWLRALSLFHLPLVAVLLWMLVRQGYDPRAWPAQTLLAWVVLPLARWLGDTELNVNWVHGLGPEMHDVISPEAYLALYMVVLPTLVPAVPERTVRGHRLFRPRHGVGLVREREPRAKRRRRALVDGRQRHLSLAGRPRRARRRRDAVHATELRLGGAERGARHLALALGGGAALGRRRRLVDGGPARRLQRPDRRPARPARRPRRDGVGAVGLALATTRPYDTGHRPER